jgi:hypothetical protein
LARAHEHLSVRYDFGIPSIAQLRAMTLIFIDYFPVSDQDDTAILSAGQEEMDSEKTSFITIGLKIITSESESNILASDKPISRVTSVPSSPLMRFLFPSFAYLHL